MVCAKTAEPIEMSFGRLTDVGPKTLLGGGQGWTNSFTAARNNKLGITGEKLMFSQ